jgi:hypothetical protein
MRKLFKSLGMAAFIIVLSGCKPEASSSPSPGADRDDHGCIPSAGYQWCGKENKCVKSWELAEEKGIENSLEAFKNYCQ